MGNARRTAAAIGLALAAACTPLPRESPRQGTVQGNVLLTPGSRGDAFVFLFPQRATDVFSLLQPVQTTAVSDVRLAAGDARYVFSAVEPNPYRVSALLDVDRNLRADVDVLAQPGAGDRLSSAALELNLQPGEHLSLDVAIDQHVAREPPAFRIEGHEGDALELPDQPSLSPLTLVATDLGLLDPLRGGFAVTAVDADGNGTPDDSDGDGIPELYPQFALRFLPRPGQTVPVSASGRPGPVVVPLAFNPAPFLAALGGDLTRSVVVDQLQVFLVPQAALLLSAPGRGLTREPLDAIPVGDYELWVLTQTSQYWRLPNGLGATHPDQAVRFRFVHGGGFDGGLPP